MQKWLYKNIDQIIEKILAIYEILLVHSIQRKDNFSMYALLFLMKKIIRIN